MRNSKKFVRLNLSEGINALLFEQCFLILNDTAINITTTMPDPTIWS